MCACVLSCFSRGPTLCDLEDCSPPGSSVHEILQAEWAAISSSRGSSPPRDRTRVSYVSRIGRQVLFLPAPPGKSSHLPLVNPYFQCSEQIIRMIYHQYALSPFNPPQSEPPGFQSFTGVMSGHHIGYCRSSKLAPMDWVSAF